MYLESGAAARFEWSLTEEPTQVNSRWAGIAGFGVDKPSRPTAGMPRMESPRLSQHGAQVMLSPAHG